MNHTAGDVLGGRYRLLDLLARGGMGEVWRAKDERLGREVAVKVLHSAYAGDSAFHERFRAEARNTAAFAHPGVAQVYDFGEADGAPYLVMELVPGEPLSVLLDRGPLGVARTLDVLAQSARALQAAHAAGVVHRDVKPGNLLVRPDGVVKVTDFGIARAADALPLTATGTVMGSAPYLSPEQAHGRAATPASDVYALGVLAYECLAGHRPFIGETAVDVAAAHASDPPPPLPLSVPQPLKDLVLAMLAKDPAQRPDDAQVAERAEALGGATAALATGTAPLVPDGGWHEPVPTRTEVIPPVAPVPPARPYATGPAGPGAAVATGGLRPFTPEPRRRGRVAALVVLGVALVAAAAVGLGTLLTGGSGSSGDDRAGGGSPSAGSAGEAAPASASSTPRPSPRATSASPRASASASPSASASTSPSATPSPTASSGSPSPSGSTSPSSSPSASPGASFDPQALVGRSDSDAFAALRSAGWSYTRLRRALDDTHTACQVAAVDRTGPKAAAVTVWWPTDGSTTCADLSSGRRAPGAAPAAAAALR